MTVGFVEPYDGFDLDRLSGPDAQPTNPELLEAMAADFRASGFRLKQLIRTIMTSSVYQLSSRFPGAWDDRYINYYPRKYVRVMSGPEVVDAVAEATGVPMRFTLTGEPARRVKQLTAPQDVGRRGEGQAVDSLMQSFFQSNRRTPAPSANKPSTLQALLMMRSTVVNDRVEAKARGRAGELVDVVRDACADCRRAVPGHAGARAAAGGSSRGGRRRRRESPARHREPAVGAAQHGGVPRESLGFAGFSRFAGSEVRWNDD